MLKKRFSNQIPPGYADEKEKGEDFFIFQGYKYFNKFGDLVVFKEIIKHAKENSLENIVFISEEKKEDWRECVQTSNQKKILGIRHELKDELYRESEVKNIFIFNQEQFISYTNKFLATNVDQESINRMNKTIERVNSRIINKNFLKEVNIAPGLEELELATSNSLDHLNMLSQMNSQLQTEIKSLERYIAKAQKDIHDNNAKYHFYEMRHHKLMEEEKSLTSPEGKFEMEFRIKTSQKNLSQFKAEKELMLEQYQSMQHQLHILQQRSKHLIREIDQELEIQGL